MKVIVKVISNIANWWNLKTNQRHWYEIKFTYMEDGIDQFSWIDQIGLLEKRMVLNRREIKKTFEPVHKMKFRSPVKLKNGILVAGVICYLGKFNNNLK